MEKDNKHKANPPIDEDYLMDMMAGGEKSATPEQDTSDEQLPVKGAAREKGKQKRSIGETDYQKLFFKNPDTNARNGKSVYIRPEFHERLTRIVQIIGADKLTIYAYLDNVLEYHFQQFAEEITTSFNEKYKPIL